MLEASDLKISIAGGLILDIVLTPELEAALNTSAEIQGMSPQELVLDTLKERFLTLSAPLDPIDDWEPTILGLGTDCGVSLTHSALSSEGLYD